MKCVKVPVVDFFMDDGGFASQTWIDSRACGRVADMTSNAIAKARRGCVDLIIYEPNHVQAAIIYQFRNNPGNLTLEELGMPQGIFPT